MKVKELIEYLQQFNGELKVIVCETDLFGYATSGEATDVFETEFEDERTVRVY